MLPQYEISNFAKPGRESRHNLKYWKLQEYAGFGPGAHSDFGGVRYAYEKDLDATSPPHTADSSAFPKTPSSLPETGTWSG